VSLVIALFAHFVMLTTLCNLQILAVLVVPVDFMQIAPLEIATLVQQLLIVLNVLLVFQYAMHVSLLIIITNKHVFHTTQLAKEHVHLGSQKPTLKALKFVGMDFAIPLKRMLQLLMYRMELT